MSDLTKIMAGLFLMGLSGCASITPPTGGPKDEKPPQLLKSVPENGAINVNQQSIFLEFDEEVSLNSLNQQLLITPNTGNSYTTRILRNGVELRFAEPLEKNTTYTFNFREGIQDVTERNKPQNLLLTFSTGAYLDSGQVRGVVTDLLRNQPEANISIMLYRAEDTATIRKHKPYYYTKADNGGRFELKNLKTGAYTIYAVDDKNNNLIWDPDNERIGYLGEPIQVAATPDTVLLKTVYLDTKKPYIATRSATAETFRIDFNEGLTAFKAAPLTDSLQVIPFIQDQSKKTVTLFKTDAYTGGRIRYVATDSAMNVATDTIVADLNPEAPVRAAHTYKLKNNLSEIYRKDQIQLEFDVPFVIQAPEAVVMLEDTTRKVPLEPGTQLRTGDQPNIMILNIDTKAKKIIDILIDTTKVTGVGGQVFRKTPIRLNITNRMSTGNISGRIRTDKPSFILELLTSNYEVKRTVQNAKFYSFENIEPGNYFIRVKIDSNNNGVWERGDKELKVEPEEVYFHPNPITIRSNWDLEDINIEF